MGERAGDVYAVEADWERVSWLTAGVRIALAALGISEGAKSVVRVIDRRALVVVMENKWDSTVSTEADYEAIKQRLETMTVAEFEKAYNLRSASQ